MTEHAHYGPLIIGGNAEGMRLYRIHDGGGKNPFDIGGVCACGLGVALEVKLEKLVTPRMDMPIKWSMLDTQQATWIKAFAETGANGMVAVYYAAVGIMQITTLSDMKNKIVYLKKQDGIYKGLRSACRLCGEISVNL